MTENMAARGEGLAGLGERKRLVRRLILAIAKEAVELAIVRSELTWDEAADITEEQIAKDAALAIFGAGTCDDQPTENVQKLLAALEAAARLPAPALRFAHDNESLEEFVRSLAHATIYHGHDTGDVIGEYWREEAIEWVKEFGAAALATPSPQAPQRESSFSTTSAREQSSATASDSLRAAELAIKHCREQINALDKLEGATEYEKGDFAGQIDAYAQVGEILHDLIHVKSVPAATQEQPAGSAPIESFMDNMPVITVTGGAPPNCSPPIWKQPGILSVGSPRKVGEAADRAYCDYIDQMRKPECLGYEQKLKEGRFGKAELDAHVRAGELLGRHRALAEVALAPSRQGAGGKKS